MAQRTKVFVDIVTKAESGSGSALAKYAVAAGAAAVAVGLLVKTSKVLIDAYSIQEQAEVNLTSAIKATGKESTISMDAMTTYASSLQDVTKFGDEAILSGQALLQSLADLDQDGLQKVTPAVLDFATGMGVDVKTAMSLVGKTLGSSTNALTRYGIEIDMSGTKSEKLAALTEALNDKFGGMAQAAADTATGGITQLSNTMGDLKEAYGRNIAEGINPFVMGLKDIVTQMVEGTNKAHDLKEALNIVDEGGQTTAAQTLLILENQRDFLGQIAAGYEMMDEKANAAYEQAQQDIDNYNRALELQLAYEKQASDQADSAAALEKERNDVKMSAIEELATLQWDALSADEQRLMNIQKEINELWKYKDIAEVMSLINELAAERNELQKESVEVVEELTTAYTDFAEINMENYDAMEARSTGWVVKTKADIEELKMSYEDLATNGLGAFASAFKEVGEGNDTLMEGLKEGAKNAISSMLEMYAQLWLAQAVAAAASLNFISAAGYTAAAAGAYAASGLVQSFATGGSFTANEPTLIQVGEQGQENVTVTPTSGSGGGGSTERVYAIVDGNEGFWMTIQRGINNRAIKSHSGDAI